MPASPLIGARLSTTTGSTITAQFPTTGTGASRAVAVGDVLVCAVGAAYAVSSTPPSGWLLRERDAGSSFNGAVLTKTATSADIAASSVAIDMTGTYAGTAIVLAFEPGTTIDFRGKPVDRSGSTTPSTQSTELVDQQSVVYLAFSRSSTPTTISRGTTLASTSLPDAAAMSSEEAGPLASTTVTYAPAANSGRYEIAIIGTADGRAPGTLASEMAADSPWGWWRQDETSGGTLADSSSNGRALTVAGTPSYGNAGPVSGEKAVAWPASTSVHAVSSATFSPGALGWTYEAWVYLTSNPAGFVPVLSAAVNATGTADVETYVGIRPDGKVEMGKWSNFWFASTSPSALTLNTWHHVAASQSPRGGMRLTVDGQIVAYSAEQNLPPSSAKPMRLHAGYGNGGGAVQISNAAVYAGELPNWRIQSHYDAALSPEAGSIALSLSGNLSRKAAAFSLAAESVLALAGTRAPRAGSFTLASPSVVSMAGTLRRKTAAIAMEIAPSTSTTGVALAATMQPKVATFASRAVTPVTSAPTSVGSAAALSVVVAQAFGPVTMHGTQPVYTVSEAHTPRARQQIVVDGVDVTYFRDVVTPDVTYTLLEPLLYGPGTLDLPQVSACFDRPGVGDLAWLRPQAPVEVNLVVDDVAVGTVYKGFVAAFDLNGRTLSIELGGEANGRAAMRDRQNPIFPRINDIGHQIADAVRDLGLPHYPPLGAVTGIETMTTGGTGHLDHINDLVAKSWTRSGKQWTVMPDEATGVYETHRKDATTIHATAFIDDARTVANLRRDIAEEPNQIFVTCVTPAGMRVRFGKYPGLVQGPVPDFPGNMAFGDTGEGVRLLVGKLHASGYLKLSEVAGGFDADVDEAVRQLQDDAGLLETGVVNLATWRALYDLDVTGLSLEWANIQPAAQRSKTRKFNRSANGTIMGFNDEYDSDVIVRHRTIDLGPGVTRRQAREFARTVLHDSDAPNWVGDITFHAGALIRGEGFEGMTLAEANVMDARDLRPGMNLWLPQFDGGTVLHVSACQVNGDGIVTATVDTRFRDAMEVWEVIARNKESRNDPSRHRARRYRASTIVKDSIGEWDEFGGFLGVDLPLERGWTVFPVVAAMEGQIREFGIKLDTPGEFAVAVFGKKIDAGWLDGLIPHPLTVSGTQAWEKKGKALKDNWFLYSYGTHDEPAGYFPGRKKWRSVTGEEPNPDYNPTADADDTGSDDTETVEVTTSDSFGEVTGEFVDEAGFPYFAYDRKVIWVAVWVRGANKIPAGRIMKPQLEAGA